MGSTDGRSIKTTARIRNKAEDLFSLLHHDQPPHPASLKSTKRRNLRGLTKGRRR